MTSLKKFLLQQKAYVQFRFAPLTIRIWLFLRPGIRKKLASQKKYYLGFLDSLKDASHLAFDIGANEGFVAQNFLEKGMKVIAVEPDPRNISILHARFRKNPHFILLEGAAGSNPGTKTFFMQRGGSTLSTMSPKWKELIESGKFRLHDNFIVAEKKVPIVTLDSLIAANGIPAFLKIDVEGYEFDVLMGLNQKVPLLFFEANLPVFLDETKNCILRLAEIDKDSQFTYSAAWEDGIAAPFMEADSLIKCLPKVEFPNIDVICKMSNFSQYYREFPGS